MRKKKKRTAVKGGTVAMSPTSPALPCVWAGECIGRSTASCRTQLLGRSVLWTESPQETPGICSPMNRRFVSVLARSVYDARPGLLCRVSVGDGRHLQPSPHRGRSARTAASGQAILHI